MAYINDATISEYECTAGRPLLVYNNSEGQVVAELFPHKELVEAFEKTIAGFNYTSTTIE